MPVLKIAIIVLLLLIFTEDMRSRSVHWYLFPLLAATLIAMRLLEPAKIREIMSSSAINLSFLFLQLLLVTGYFSLKHKRFVNIANGLLGWGDILFLTAIAFYFATATFIVFYIASLLVILTGWLAYINIKKTNTRSIPLAGLQAALFAFLISLSWISPAVRLTEDSQFLNLLIS